MSDEQRFEMKFIRIFVKVISLKLYLKKYNISNI
jgi:hypothetical protein